MSLKDTVIHDVQVIEGVLKNAIAGYQKIVTTPTAEKIIKDIPGMAHLAEKLAALIPGISEGLDFVDVAIEYGPTLYAIGVALHMQPNQDLDNVGPGRKDSWG